MLGLSFFPSTSLPAAHFFGSGVMISDIKKKKKKKIAPPVD